MSWNIDRIKHKLYFVGKYYMINRAMQYNNKQDRDLINNKVKQLKGHRDNTFELEKLVWSLMMVKCLQAGIHHVYLATPFV